MLLAHQTRIEFVCDPLNHVMCYIRAVGTLIFIMVIGHLNIRVELKLKNCSFKSLKIIYLLNYF